MTIPSLARIWSAATTSLLACAFASAQTPSLVWFEDIALSSPLPPNPNYATLKVLPRQDGGAWVHGSLSTYSDSREVLYSFSRDGSFLGEISLGGPADGVHHHEPDGVGGIYRLRTLTADVVVERFDQTGQLIWRERIGTNSIEFGAGLALMSDGGVCVVGKTGGNGDLGGAGVPGVDAAFAAKLSSAGGVEWLTRIELLGTQFQGLTLLGVEADAEDRLFFAYQISNPACYINCYGWKATRLAADGSYDWSGTLISSADSYDRSAAMGSILPDGTGGLWAPTSEWYYGGNQYHRLKHLSSSGGAAPSPSLTTNTVRVFNGLIQLPDGRVATVERTGAASAYVNTARSVLLAGMNTASPSVDPLLGEDGTASWPEDCAMGDDGSLWIVGLRQTQSTEVVSAWIARYDFAPIGTTTACVANVNSTGETAQLTVSGNTAVSAGDVHLAATQLPAHSTALFVAASAQGNLALPGSNGVLCVSGSIGRFAGAGQVRTSDRFGFVDLPVDPMSLPNGPGFVAASAGETWYFQAWFRDDDPAPTSNLTTAVGVLFQ